MENIDYKEKRWVCLPYGQRSLSIVKE